jgi:LysM repeat protein
MIAPAMVARSRGRYLAPLALLGTILAIALVVRGGLHSKANPGATPATPTSTTATSHTSTSKPTFYVVQPGDSLSTISVKTHVSVGQLESSNPGLNPNVLQAGQRLKLGP